MKAKPRELCSQAEFCSEPENKKIGNFKGPGCDICKLAVAKIDIALEDKKTQVRILNIFIFFGEKNY